MVYLFEIEQNFHLVGRINEDNLAKVRYVDEGSELRGTAGALRLALDQGVLDPQFLMTYGDSFLPVDCGAVWETFLANGAPALMTVFKNEGQWDTSNVVFRDGKIKLYDKFRQDDAQKPRGHAPSCSCGRAGARGRDSELPYLLPSQ
ncbi:hypothetical protein WDW86_02125 [Bdellovibrionota bacterium FG-2]